MRLIAAAIALLAVTACSEGGDPVQMALRDAAAARQAAAAKEGATSAPVASPVATRTTAPSTSEADAAYVAGMIEHHRAAMAMAVDALARSEDPEIRRLARADIDARSRQIAQLQAWKPAG